MAFRDDASLTLSSTHVAPVVRDAVENMVHQFADRFAFYRELVQNSIDAGATRIDVRLSYEPREEDHGLVRIVVSDDGCGMDQDTIERCLLVLFRSSKEGDASKIGKFGVGFFSVFAVEPESVLVDTGRGDAGLRLTLQRDQTYELERIEPRTGTSVTLRVPMELAEIESFVSRSSAALQRWCEHVAVPIGFAAQRTKLDPDTPIGEGWFEVQINRPFGTGEPVELVRTEGETRIAVTFAQPGGAAFYKRGILLARTDAALVEGLLFKVDSDRLGHTISRDDVRRDAAFFDALKTVRRVARKWLEAHVIVALNQATDAYVRACIGRTGIGDAREKLRAVSAVLAVAPPPVDSISIELPVLSNAGAGADRAIRFSTRDAVFFSASRDVLTDALARRGVDVVDASALDAGAYVRVPPILATAFSGRVRRAQHAFSAVELIGAKSMLDCERAVFAALSPLLRTLGLTALRLGRFHGVASDAAFIAVPGEAGGTDARVLVVESERVSKTATGWFDSGVLAVNRAHARWRIVSAAAARDATLAASLFAQLVALTQKGLSAGKEAALLTHALRSAP